MPSSARFATFARIQLRAAVALTVPAAALTLVLAAQPASADPAAVTASDQAAVTTAVTTSVTASGTADTSAAQPTDSNDGFSWG
ncbi:hypothetical protein [Streptomyces sp. NPDC047141]|uniref:hypothetical protein n=1 Tax=Streptomyces sp. NPDC047141 TaxID=3155738 RepID=UPI0033D28E83